MAYGPGESGQQTIALAPDNPQELLAATDVWGGIIRSTDGGNQWEIASNHLGAYADPEHWHGFRTITYAPSNPDIVYAGMGKTINVGMFDPSDEPSFGIYKSSDRGQTWAEVNSRLENSTKIISDIVAHPLDPDIAYAATLQDGVFKTTNGGQTWGPMNNGLVASDVRSLAIDPENPEIVYAGLGEGAGVFKTTNGGELWEAINYGIQVECPSYLQRVGQVSPGVSLVKPSRLQGVDYYSVPWTSIRSIVIDPTSTQTVYAADSYLGVYVSADGGASWHPVNDGLSTKAVATLALSADGQVLYAATSGEGVFRLDLP